MRTQVFWACIGIAIASSDAQAQQNEYAKLVPNDGAWRDWFGEAVAINGSTAMIGSRNHSDFGNLPGVAYLFDTTTGEQRAMLFPSDGEVGDRFGGAVAIDSDTAIGGATSNYNQRGAAYLFDSTTGVQLATLLANDGVWYDLFGWAVAIDGGVAIVGAIRDGDNGSNSGSAYLFSVPMGEQIAKLLPSDGAADDWFGYSVSVSGTRAVVGAHFHADNGTWSGAAYLFDTADGQQLAKLLATDGAVGDHFGRSVSISGNTVLVGAFAEDDNGTDSGAAYLFDVSDPANPVQLAKLLPSDGAAGDLFGYTVSISGNQAVVGAPGNDDNGSGSGAAYLFDVSVPSSPVQTAKLLPSDGAAHDNFGQSVDLSGTTVVSGAYLDDVFEENSGSAYLFSTVVCTADLTGDGLVNTQDFIAFLNAWASGDPVADWNEDGTINTQDFIAYLNDWAAGC